MEIWIYFTLLAATMQAVRTAGQKKLSSHLNAMANTSVRFVFALPFAWAYLFWMMDYRGVGFPQINAEFTKFAVAGSISQILGTISLIIAFNYRNFSVATSLSKTEAIQVAIVGALFLSAPLSFWGWFSVIIGVVGLLIVSKVRFTYDAIFRNPGAGFGIASGLGLAIATLFIRESNLALNYDLMVSAAFTLVTFITIQTLLSVIYIFVQDSSQFKRMLTQWRLCLFVGVTSVVGSIGWFTAASYQNSAYIKALGQVEFFITLFLTYRIFKEKISAIEYLGMALILGSVLILLLWA